MTTERTSEIYKRIYHYTTLQGAWGILTSNCLWATHIKFVNDYSEMILSKERLSEFLYPHVLDEYKKMMKEFPNAAAKIAESGGLDVVVKHDTAGVIHAQYSALGNEIYITSFCGEHKDSYINDNGLLSQWRGYGGNGGVALVFGTEKLEEMLRQEGKTCDGIGFLG